MKQWLPIKILRLHILLLAWLHQVLGGGQPIGVDLRHRSNDLRHAYDLALVAGMGQDGEGLILKYRKDDEHGHDEDDGCCHRAPFIGQNFQFLAP